MASDRFSAGSGDLSVELVAQRSFTQTRRGFDPVEVRDFLGRVSSELRYLRERVETAEQARHEAEQRAAHPAFDEATLLGVLGEQTATILGTARNAAADITSKATSEAQELVSDATQRAAKLKEDAERIASTTLETARNAAHELGAKAEAEAERLLREARESAESVRRQADQERKSTIEGAQAIREKILADLARRRSLTTVQIDQLRAGRDRLLDAYVVVRRTLDEVTSELHRADAEAGAASEEVGRQIAAADPTGHGDIDITLTEASAVAAPQQIPPAPTSTAPTSTAPTSTAQTAPPQVPSAQTPVQQAPSRQAPVVERGPAPKRTWASASVSAQTAAVASSDFAGTSEASDEQADIRSDRHSSDEEIVLPARMADETPEEELEGPELVSVIDDGVDRVRIFRGSAPASVTPRASQSDKPVRPGRRSDTPPVLLLKDEPATETASTLIVSDEPVVVESVTVVREEPPVESETAATQGTASVQQDVEEHADPIASAEAPRAAKGVDDLFARLRASREQEVAGARDVLAREPDTIPNPVIEAGEEASSEVDEQDDDDVVDVIVSDEDELLLQRRDEATTQLESSLARKLKRALQDEQNDILDRLRALKGTPDVATLLPSSEEHAARFAAAGRPVLEQAAKAGAKIAAEMSGKSIDSRTLSSKLPDLDDLAAALAHAITDPLRQRLEIALRESAGEDQTDLADALGSAYREWKTQRIEAAAGDHVASAYARGAYLAFGEGEMLRWIAQDVDGPCADCDDNVLEGEQTKGEPWPTGQLHPPAHPGCRCILVPVTGV